MSTKFNAHDHNDIDQTANTLNVGDAVAGDKTITANNADTNKPYLKYDDTNNYWVFSDDGVAPSVVIHGNSVIFEGTTDNAFETTLSVTDPTADRTQTIQNNGGVIPLGTAGNTLFFTTTGATNITLPTSVTIGIGTVSSRVHYTSVDITTTSTSLVDLTGASITLTTGANPVLIGFSVVVNENSAANVTFNVDIDGTLQMGTIGLSEAHGGTGINMMQTFVIRTAALTAASHTIKIQWLVTAGTGTVLANTDRPYNFWVTEITD